ncbi:hypothetical protein ACOME3_006376 [Neoechinorhynchus agilis]
METHRRSFAAATSTVSSKTQQPIASTLVIDQPSATSSRFGSISELSTNTWLQLNNILNDFSTKILQMVYLRIISAIQNLERRLEKHFEALTNSISLSLSRINIPEKLETRRIEKISLDLSETDTVRALL